MCRRRRVAPVRYLLFVLAAAGLVLLASGCEQAGPSRNSATEEEPLLLEDVPLLLDDPLAAEGPEGPIADNSRCFVCHINYMQEDIAVIHARRDMGCAYCHGESDEHIADESWASGGNGTAPDIMYRKPDINPFCLNCHPKDKLPSEEHKELFAGTALAKYCTDCHGDHRLANRKCKWK